MTGRTVRMGLVGIAATVLLGGTAVSAAGAPLPPLELGAVRIAPRCLGFGENAGPELRISYAITTPARVNITVQQRTAAGLPVPGRCPSALQAGTNMATYASVAALDLDANAGPGVAAVQQPGEVTVAALPGGPAARAPLTITRTIRAAKGRHTIALLHTLGAARAFPPGRYRALVQAIRADGAISRMATVWFWVLRPPATSRTQR